MCYAEGSRYTTSMCWRENFLVPKDEQNSVLLSSSFQFMTNIYAPIHMQGVEQDQTCVNKNKLLYDFSAKI